MTASPSPLRRIAERANSWLGGPSRAVLLAADDLLVEAPAEGSVWPCGSRQTVRWRITGPVDPVSIHLVQKEGTQTRTRAVLAEDLPSHETQVAVTVPTALAPGEYLVMVTSQALLDAYSRPLRVTAPGASGAPGVPAPGVPSALGEA
ncbi:GPI anchored serine-threonine rich family protein [Actinomycetota bacterium Odt1-20B]